MTIEERLQQVVQRIFGQQQFQVATLIARLEDLEERLANLEKEKIRDIHE